MCDPHGANQTPQNGREHTAPHRNPAATPTTAPDRYGVAAGHHPPTKQRRRGDATLPSQPATTPYRHAAHTYYQAGWRGVLPLPPGRKTPPPQGFTGDAGAWPSYADIQAWLDDAEGNGNIALRLPQHVLGIDVDHYGQKHGADTVADAESEYGPLPATWVTTSRLGTPSGIKLYRVPEGLRWPGELGPDTELIQHRHRYAVVWPSMHPDGRQYTWVNPAGQRTTTPPNVDDLPALPETWVIALTGGATHTNTPRNTLPPATAVAWLRDTAPQPHNPCTRVDTALRRCLDDLATGSRHAAARDATMRLTRLAAEGHTGAYAAVQQFADTFLTACADPTRGAVRHPATAQHEFVSMLTGAVNLITAERPDGQPQPADPCTDTNPFPGLISATSYTTPTPTPTPTAAEPATATTAPAQPQQFDPLLAQEVARLRIRHQAQAIIDAEAAAAAFHVPEWRPTLTAELAIPDEPVAYTIDAVMPTGANVLLTAAFKAGKTTLVNHLARALADKEPFLGVHDVTALQGRVALCNYEVDPRQYRRWLREVGINNTDRVVVLNLRGYSMPLTVPHVRQWLTDWLAAHEVAVWIVDPFARAFVGSGDSENDNTQVGAFLDALDVIKHRAGVSDLVMPTHTGRAEQQEGQERARGATRLDDWADVRWLLTTDDAGQRYFRATGRDVEVPEGQLYYDGATRALTVRTGAGRGEQRNHRIAALLLAVVEQTPGISYNALRNAVRERLGPTDNRVIDEVRVDLIKGGRIRYVSPQREGQAGKHWPADASDWLTGHHGGDD